MRPSESQWTAPGVRVPNELSGLPASALSGATVLLLAEGSLAWCSEAARAVLLDVLPAAVTSGGGVALPEAWTASFRFLASAKGGYQHLRAPDRPLALIARAVQPHGQGLLVRLEVLAAETLREHARAIVDAIPLPAIAVARDGQCLAMNEGCRARMSASADEATAADKSADLAAWPWRFGKDTDVMGYGYLRVGVLAEAAATSPPERKEAGESRSLQRAIAAHLEQLQGALEALAPTSTAPAVLGGTSDQAQAIVSGFAEIDSAVAAVDHRMRQGSQELERWALDLGELGRLVQELDEIAYESSLLALQTSTQAALRQDGPRDVLASLADHWRALSDRLGDASRGVRKRITEDLRALERCLGEAKSPRDALRFVQAAAHRTGERAHAMIEEIAEQRRQLRAARQAKAECSAKLKRIRALCAELGADSSDPALDAISTAGRA